VRKWTNVGTRPPPKLAPYTAYATGEASSSRRRLRSSTSSSASNDDEDYVDSGRVIGPEDFVKEPAEGLANTAEEEAERLAALRAVEAF
jgi:hypothetical protein